MTISKTTEIFWRETTPTYLYGSELTFLAKDHVVFENALMSPGKAITTWYATTNYQAQRFSPQLPLLQKQHQYEVQLCARSFPERTLFLRLTFYDYMGDQLSQKYLKAPVTTFAYPQNATDYTLALINAGCEKVDFQKVLLTPLE